MKHLLLAAVVVAVATASQAKEPAELEEFVVGQARIASLFSLIGGECSQIMRINDAATRKAVDGAINAGREVTGLEQFRILAEHEMLKYGAEIQREGKATWCRRQRDFIHSYGMKVFLD